MNPTQHRSSNDILRPPPGATNEQCRPLAITRVVYEPSGMRAVVSYWQPSADDLRLLNEGRPIYMSCWGTTHPPVAIGVDGDGRLD